MDSLKALIEKVDDDYLTGLSNKGTVKRAYKDLEQEAPVVLWREQEAEVRLKEESCIIRSPLQESGCSCPSRSICRHVLTAILWLKREQGGEEKGEEREEAAGQTKGETGQAKEAAEQMKEAAGQAVFEEILALPAKRLKSACGSKGYRQFLAHARTGDLPSIEESSIVTVTIPWEKAVVKLMTPFQYSACSCHSRELCSHKAQAVLACQMKKGLVTIKELEALQTEENPLDEKAIKKACDTILGQLGQQISEGLFRQSPEAAESLERLAVIAHRSGLPGLEGSLRAASSCYGQYFSRSASFRTEELLENLLSLYRRTKRLARSGQQEEIRLLAGNFRDAYEPAGKLHLVGMGERSFISKTGYEGEIYYFLETEQKKWYTWTDARPTIYETAKKTRPSGMKSAQAPWDLNCGRGQLQNLEFTLQNAMAAFGGRLSVSQKSKGEAVGIRDFGREDIGGMIVWDFERLLRELSDCGEQEFDGRGKESGKAGREKLTLAGAVRFEETVFDTVAQQFSWCVYDGRGRKLFIALRYTREEQTVIRMLERLEKRLRGQPPGEIVFFGSLYIDERGRLCLYPIEVFFDEDFGSGRKEEPLTDGEEKDDGEVYSSKILSVMKQYLEEATSCLLDVFASGFASVQEETLSELSELSKEGERLGLHQAGEALAEIGRLLQERRHRMDFLPEPVILETDRLFRYLRLCGEKLSRDMALHTMRGRE